MFKKFFIFTVCALAVMLLPSAIVWGAQTTRTLQPGRTYEFVGIDARVISHVNVSGTPRFEIVETNAQGEVQSFGFSGRRFSVSGTGSIAVTPVAAMSVTFDSSRLRLYESEGHALRQISLQPRQTVSIRNTATSGLHLRTNQAGVYDFLILDRFDEIHNFGREARFPQLSIPAGGTVMITSETYLTVYFPSAWYGKLLYADFLYHPALAVQELEAEQVYIFANPNENVLVLHFNPAYENTIFRYEYILRGRDGHIIRHGTATGNQISMEPGQSFSVTPQINAELIRPYIWNFDIAYGMDAPLYYALALGNSLSVTNTDPNRVQVIHVQNLLNEAYEFYYDFVLQDGDEVIFATGETAGLLTIPPGAVLNLTASTHGLAVNFPDTPTIIVEPCQPALTRLVLEPDTTIEISYQGENYIYMLTATDNRHYLDFVLWYDGGETLADFGHKSTGRINFQDGDKIRLTNPGDEPITLYTPRIWYENGLTVEASDSPALFRLVIEEGEAFYINNIDRNYNHTITVEHENGRLPDSGRVFEYVLTDQRRQNRNVVIDYGMGNLNTNTIFAYSRMNISPLQGQTISIAFPSEWYGQHFRVSSANNLPLHRITLRPGQRITFNNRTRNDFTLSNNSAPAGAGYFLRLPEEAIRIASDELNAAVIIESQLTQRLMQLHQQHANVLMLAEAAGIPIDDTFYALLHLDLQRDLENIRAEVSYLTRQQEEARLLGAGVTPGEIPRLGAISLPAGASITIIASIGADLEIYMPREWATQLRL